MVEVDQLVELYATGINARQLTTTFGINRETALLHLQRRGVPSRASIRKLTDAQARDAARRYLEGEAMGSLCATFGVNATTLR